MITSSLDQNGRGRRILAGGGDTGQGGRPLPEGRQIKFIRRSGRWLSKAMGMVFDDHVSFSALFGQSSGKWGLRESFLQAFETHPAELEQEHRVTIEQGSNLVVHPGHMFAGRCPIRT